jgi:hypothetical protein
LYFDTIEINDGHKDVPFIVFRFYRKDMTVKDAIERAQNDARISSVEREHARPTVKEIFALRKQGKIEEAYEAIRPIYREHKGKYTTLCMFWVAADV